MEAILQHAMSCAVLRSIPVYHFPLRNDRELLREDADSCGAGEEVNVPRHCFRNLYFSRRNLYLDMPAVAGYPHPLNCNECVRI